MGRAPCCDKSSVKRGPWSPEEDEQLRSYVQRHGIGGNWIALPQKAELPPAHGGYTEQEDQIIWSLYSSIGSRWSIIASKLPGRTDNDVKNYWNTKLKKKAMAAVAATGSVAALAAPATPLALSPAASASSSVTSSSSGDVRFAAYPSQQQHHQQGLMRFDAPQRTTKQTELAPVTELTQLDVTGGGAWASSAAASGAAVAELEDDVFLPGLVGGGEQLFPYGDFFGGMMQDRALELSACYFLNMAEMWGAAASDAKPQGLCNTLT
nr:unnamed protein product [Digitaria exilis]